MHYEVIERRDKRGRFVKKACVHHWRVDDHNIGTCKKCGEVRDFGALLAKEGHKKLPQQLRQTLK